MNVCQGQDLGLETVQQEPKLQLHQTFTNPVRLTKPKNEDIYIVIVF